MPKHLRSAVLLSTLTLLALSSSTFLASPARADDANDAKAHYQKATAHYAVGEYHDAAMEYEAAYKAKQDPALLYNAAQSHRLANDNQKALLLYKNIVKLYPTSKYAAESKDRIGKLEQAIATTQSPPNQPAPVTLGAAPAATPAAPPPSTTPGAPAATLTATAPPPQGATPIYETWWFWTGAGVVVAAAVVGVVLATSTTKPWNNVANVNGSMP